MKDIKRLFVEKKTGYNIEALHILKDLKENLSIETIKGLRILNRYDVGGLTKEEFDICKNSIFAEANVDNIFEDNFDFGSDFSFAVKYLPGQYDQRADSAVQCIQIVTGVENPVVETAKIYICEGNLSEEDREKIKNYSINPVDSMEFDIKKAPCFEEINTDIKETEIFAGFISMSKEDLANMRAKLSLAMTFDDLVFCQDYFKNEEKRDPSETEIKVIDTYWSDHCRHTTFLTELENIDFEDGSEIIKNAYHLYLQEKKIVYAEKERATTLMDIALMGMKSLKKKGFFQDADESLEVNACSINAKIEVDGKPEDWLIMFKNETHNHPTEIEPFGGAATCLGGAIRDPLSGRAYVYQAMRVTGSGNPTKPVKDTLMGKLPQSKITKVAAQGYSSYGNQIGLATGHVEEIYHEGYVAKRMEIGAVIAATKKENVVREIPTKGDVVILVGGRTGRDGCGGATGSSKEHTEESILLCGAEVQKGNAPTERKLQRLFRNPKASKLIKRCNDFGAGGVCVAIGELADGLVINLDKVLKKYEGLSGTELAISESQERMAVVVKKEDAEKFIVFSGEENLEAVIVAEVTDENRLIMNFKNQSIVNISRNFLDTAGVKQKSAVKVSVFEKINLKELNDNFDFEENLKNLNVACQKGLIERFDCTIGSVTVLMPFGGKHRLTPTEAMVGKIPVETGNTKDCSIMSFGYNPFISSQNPFCGALYAVIESLAKITAVGGDYKKARLTFQEYFERLGDDPTKWQKPFSALLGAFYAQTIFKTPSIGGKDSMSGSFKDLTVPPTLVSFAVSMSKIDEIISPEFKKSGNLLARLTVKHDENSMPDFENIKQNFDLVRKNISDKKIVSVYTIGFGGTAATIAKMAFGNKLGAKFVCDNLYNPIYGGFIVEIEKEFEEEFKSSNFEIIGCITDSSNIDYNNKTISIENAIKSWIMPLEKIFPTEYYENKEIKDYRLDFYEDKKKVHSKLKIAKPKVFIPVFPGTNCEYDTKKVFEEAGAIAETFVIKNLNSKNLNESVKFIVNSITESQILVIPGGFSAGDEPEGSAKFIAAVLRNPYIKESIENLIARDGLILGICNGFQALIKLGLVPFGEFREQKENSPTLTFNAIGRHISLLAETKVISTKSPWLKNFETGEIHTVAFSHGEGRFVADESLIKELSKNGQIATQYVDISGEAGYDINSNPNGSVFAIEGITSPDGRIFGKMGHSERTGKDLYKNIPGNKNQSIFLAGVEYFL